MFVQFWLACQCPDCAVRNWVYNGHNQDDLCETAPAVKCWKCGKCSWLDDASKEIAKISALNEDGFDENEPVSEEKMNQILKDFAVLGKEAP